jgi:hypothetical protein
MANSFPFPVLQTRTMQVQVKGILSNKVVLHFGLPQGSPLSVIIWKSVFDPPSSSTSKASYSWMIIPKLAQVIHWPNCKTKSSNQLTIFETREMPTSEILSEENGDYGMQ